MPHSTHSNRVVKKPEDNNNVALAPRGMPFGSFGLMRESGLISMIECIPHVNSALNSIVPISCLYGAQEIVSRSFKLKSARKFNSTPNNESAAESGAILSMLEYQATLDSSKKSSGLKQMIQSVTKIIKEESNESERLKKIEKSMRSISKHESALPKLGIFRADDSASVKSLYNLILHKENNFSLKNTETVGKLRGALVFGNSYS